MKVLSLLLLLISQDQIPKNDPNGTWVSDSGAQYQMNLSGSDLHVKLVPGSNPRFLEYEVTLKNQEEKNTYKGAGYFVAKLANGKQCRFDTEWDIVVVSADQIIGAITSIVPDPDTCGIKEKTAVSTDLKRKK